MRKSALDEKTNLLSVQLNIQTKLKDAENLLGKEEKRRRTAEQERNIAEYKLGKMEETRDFNSKRNSDLEKDNLELSRNIRELKSAITNLEGELGQSKQVVSNFHCKLEEMTYQRNLLFSFQNSLSKHTASLRQQYDYAKKELVSLLGHIYSRDNIRTPHTCRNFECRRCGGVTFHRHVNCVAQGHNCATCGKQNHFSAVCEAGSQFLAVDIQTVELLEMLEKQLMK